MRDVIVEVGAGIAAPAILALPERPKGIVLFAHGTGSSRKSPRNQFVANALNAGGLATLLLDLLTSHEEAIDRRTGQLRFDIGLLADRLSAARRWVRLQPALRGLRAGYFGASTGAAAALVSAAAIPEEIAAIVSRGGRPDLAGVALTCVKSPTMLIVGGDDPEVLALNRRASTRMTATHEIVIVPGASHLFEEPGTLEEVAVLARYWFTRYMSGSQ